MTFYKLAQQKVQDKTIVFHTYWPLGDYKYNVAICEDGVEIVFQFDSRAAGRDFFNALIGLG